MKNLAKIMIILSFSILFSGCSLVSDETVSKIVKNEIKKSDEKLDITKPEQKKEISILFFGDLMFDRYIRQVSERRGNDFVFEKVSSFLRSSDLAVANLEGPITDNVSKSVNTEFGSRENFYFTFNKSIAKTLFDQNIKLVSIGNNHILNFGDGGLEDTKKYLSESQVDYFGDPKNLDGNYFVKEINGTKIGFVSYNQFGGRSEKTINNIKTIKNTVDAVVVYTHWGKEYENISSNYIKDLAHGFVEAGADLVIGSHPHVVQSVEEYKGKRIYYSLGNFIFDQYFSAETQRGLAVKVVFNPNNKSFAFEEIPLILERNGQTLPE